MNIDTVAMQDSTQVISASGVMVLWILGGAVIVCAIALWFVFGRKRKDDSATTGV